MLTKVDSLVRPAAGKPGVHARAVRRVWNYHARTKGVPLRGGKEPSKRTQLALDGGTLPGDGRMTVRRQCPNGCIGAARAHRPYLLGC